MSDENQQMRLFVLMVLLAIWLAGFAYSFSFLLMVPTEGGLNPRSTFLGWQGIAGMLAFALWAAGRPFAKGSGARRISAVPMALTATVVLVLIGYAALSAG